MELEPGHPQHDLFGLYLGHKYVWPSASFSIELDLQRALQLNHPALAELCGLQPDKQLLPAHDPQRLRGLQFQRQNSSR